MNAIISELRSQRDKFSDHAANLAAELAVTKAENALLEGRVKNLEEQLERAKSGNSDDQTGGSESPSDGGAVARVG